MPRLSDWTGSGGSTSPPIAADIVITPDPGLDLEADDVRDAVYELAGDTKQNKDFIDSHFPFVQLDGLP